MLVDTMKAESARVLVAPLRTTRNGRRFFSEDYQRTVVERCLAPGASVAAVAMQHGFNANLVRKWIRRYQRELVKKGELSKLLPVTVSGAVELAKPRRARRRPMPETLSARPCGPIEIQIGAALVVLGESPDLEVLRVVLDLLRDGR
jgi:transposase